MVARLLRGFYGQTPAVAFGPKKLRFLREQMIIGDEFADPPREPWSRTYINQQVKRIRRMFKWAASHEMIPVTVFQQLATVDSLRRGQSRARETELIGPVPRDRVDAIQPFVSRQVWVAVQLQLLTGARSGELLRLRPMDLDRGDNSGIWIYSPNEHKTAYRERRRVILFGPKAQAILGPFLLRSADAYCFSPAEADTEWPHWRHTERRTPLSCGNRPGTNRKAKPRKSPGEHYTSHSCHQAIQRGCDKAFPPPAPLAKRDDETREQWRRRLTKRQKAKLKAWRKARRWHPHQLRHLAATEIRREFGLEAAQVVLGHSSAQVTDAVYAERDLRKAIEVMERVG